MQTTFDKKTKYKKEVEAYFKRNSLRSKIIAWVVSAVFMAYAISLIVPFLWLILNSFKTIGDFGNNPNGLPIPPYFGNFREALTHTAEPSGANMIGMFINTLIIVCSSTLATLITSSCAAYIVAKYKFRGRNIIFSAVIFAMIVPIIGALPAQLRLMHDLGLHDTYLGVIFIYSGGFGLNFLLLYSFFKNLSWSYAEAAYIDGASDFGIFIKIMIPLAAPAMMSVAVLTFIGLWNEFAVPQIFLPSRPTLAVGLYELSGALQTRHQWTMLFAAVVVVLIPIIVVFLIFQKTIMTNTVAGGLKG